MNIRLEKRSSLLLFLILLLGLGLRVYHLGFLSIWIDEAFTRFYSENDLHFLWTTGFEGETNPPGYYTVMHFWIPLFGHSETSLRSFSVLASLASIVLVYLLGRELADETVGLIAALLIALAPAEIWYAQEARTYALLQALFALALLGLAKFLSPRRSITGLALYAIGTTIALYCHATAMIFFASCILAVIGIASGYRHLLNRRDLVRWLMATFLVALAACPVILNILHLTSAVHIEWIPAITPYRVLWVIEDIVAGSVANTQLVHGRTWALLLVEGAFFWGAWTLRKEPRKLAILTCIPLIFFAAVLLYSLHSPILLPRALLWIWIPVSILLAHALVHSGRWRLPLLALVLLVFIPGITMQLSPSASPKQDWRNFVRINRELLSRADVVATPSPLATGGLLYYMPEAAPHTVYWIHDSIAYPSIFQAFNVRAFDTSNRTTGELLSSIRSGQKVCVLIASYKSSLLDEELAGFPAPSYHFTNHQTYTYEIHLLAWNLVLEDHSGPHILHQN